MLINVIHSLTKEEVRAVKLYLNRTNAEKERKDVLLLDYVRKHPNPDLDTFSTKLYPSMGKNPFYRLKNRLLDDINRAMIALYSGENELNTGMQYVVLARHFTKQDNLKIALKYLRKAELIAQKSDQFELLDMIYTESIKLAQETLEVNPEEYINKRKQLSKKIQEIREIDDVLSVLMYKIKRSQNYGVKNLEVLKLLEETVHDYTKSKDLKNNPVLRFKIYHALSRILLQQGDYKSLEVYLKESIAAFTKEKLFKKNNHDTKLQMLVYLSNCLFKNEKYKESLGIAEELKAAISEHDEFLKKKYWFFYINALIINYSELDLNKALEVADSALQDPIITQNPLHKVFVLLNKAQIHFDLGEYKKGNKAIVKLTIDDSYGKLDRGFQLKIAVAQILFRYEMGDYDTVELLVKNVRKDFEEELNEHPFERQANVLQVILKLLVTHQIKSDEALLSDIQSLLDSADDRKASESDLINYNTWLKSKMS